MYKDKRALASTLRSYYPQHILSPLFLEAADTIEEQMRIIDGLNRDNDQLTAMIEKLTAEKDSCPITTAAKPGHWIFLTVEDDPQDPVCVFQHRYECSVCHTWQSYGMTAFCPNCGAAMEGAKDGKEN